MAQMHKELCLPAAVESIKCFTDLLEQTLEPLACPSKALVQLQVAVDELVSNVAYYAYPQGSGTVTLNIETIDDPRGVRLTFRDSGVPYDPLQKPDPDVTASADERAVGGLGIFMVKKTMDRMEYAYRDGENNLAVTKYF